MKISIIGAGFVGATTAYALTLERVAKELVIVDLNEKKAKAEALDIAHSIPLVGEDNIVFGDYEDTKNSDIVIITAGASPKYGQTRLDVINTNVKIFKDMVPKIVKYNPKAILLVVSNPVDIVTYVTYKLSGFPKHRIIGSGTVLDTSRLKYILGSYCNVNPSDVSGFVFGEHGDSQVAIWSNTLVNGIDVYEYSKNNNIIFDDEIKCKLEQKIKEAGFDIVYGKGYTNFGIATSVLRIVKAIVEDTNAVLPVATYYTGEYGIEDVYMAAPCMVGRSGIKKVLEFKITEEEKNKLNNSANTLKEIVREL